jgi:hypothetical protein
MPLDYSDAILAVKTAANAPTLRRVEGRVRVLLSFPVGRRLRFGSTKAGQFDSGNTLAHNGPSGFIREQPMALERGRYYTRSRKVNGQVVRE